MCHMPSGPVVVLRSAVAATGDREEVGYCLAQACGNLRPPGTGALAACRFVTHEEREEAEVEGTGPIGDTLATRWREAFAVW